NWFYPIQKKNNCGRLPLWFGLVTLAVMNSARRELISQQAIAIAVQTGIATLAIGEPGVAKSQFYYAMAEAFDCHLTTILPHLHDPTDFCGKPVVVGDRDLTRLAEASLERLILQTRDELERLYKAEDDEIKRNRGIEEVFGRFRRTIQGGLVPNQSRVKLSFVPPDFIAEIADRKKPTLLFVDELTCTPPAVQASLMGLMLERKCGYLKLPDSTLIAAAANPIEMAAGGWSLAAPLANRLSHFEWVPPVSTWLDGMKTGEWRFPKFFKLPPDWRKTQMRYGVLIASFIEKRMELLQKVPKTEAEKGQAFATMRSWERASQLLAAAGSVQRQIEALAGKDGFLEVETLLVASQVGEGAAHEFISWKQEMDLPDPEELLEDPGRLRLPNRGDFRHAVLTAVASAVVVNPTKERFHAAWGSWGAPLTWGPWIRPRWRPNR